MAEEKGSLRTPLGHVRYLGSARAGMREDWTIRVTSVALIPLTIGFIWLVLALLVKTTTARAPNSAIPSRRSS